MPYRLTPFVTNEIYHVVSRGVAQMPIFQNKRDYSRMLETISFYLHLRSPLRFSFYDRLTKEEKESFLKSLKNEKNVSAEIFAFCLMPNHLHFLIKQLIDGGISIFMRKLQDSYARFFNTKYERNGALFQSMFKAVRIESDEQLLHISRYIHLNPVTSYIIEISDLENYPWSSFPDYMKKRTLGFVNSSFVLNFFKKSDQYREFILNQVDYQRKINQIKHLLEE